MWFQSKDREESSLEEKSRVEVVAHKRATKRQVDQVKQVNQKLNNMLTDNGFHLEIFLAAGGQPPNPRKVR